MTNWFVYFAVIVSGASVLAIEILGTRILGPFYGVSLYLWSALIGVTLAALSLGYALGGVWADKGPRLNRFCSLLALSGLWIVLIPWLRHPVLAISESLGLRGAVLFAAFVLFFPPLALLGMVSPYAIRIKASTLEVVGRTAGNLYAVSTIASVVSAILTGFFLIPNVGVNRLTFLVGIALLGTALIGFVSRRKAKVLLPGIFITVLLGAAATQLAPAQRANPSNGLLAIEQSPYAEIRVVEKEGLRFMLIDGGMHTIADPATWESFLPYVDVLDVTRRFHTEPGRLLLVGLGGGSVVKRFAKGGWKVEAVEIDPVVTRNARRFFGLEEDEATVHHMDGRRFLLRHAGLYDLVIMDAFGSSSIPFHLVTKESFALIDRCLNADGIVAMNIEAVGWDDILVRSLVATFQEVYEHVLVLPIAEPPTEIGNLIIMASHHPFEMLEELPDPADRFSAEYNRLHAWVNSFTPETEGAPVLTDDMNPVDVWSERINLEARKGLHEYFGADGLSW